MIPLIIAAALVGGFILFAINGIIVVDIVYSKIYPKRSDGVLVLNYPNYKDYPNLITEKISFKSGKNILRGFIVKNKNIDKYKSVVVLSHGIGAGHTYLLNLVDFICNEGYIVLAFDNTASGISEGKKVYSMVQSIKDLDFALKFKENNKELQGYPTYLLGHSMGGFAVLNILNKSHKIDKCCSIAGFNNEEAMALGMIPRTKGVYPLITFRNFFRVGRNAFSTSYKSIKKSNVNILYIQGTEDKVVPPSIGGDLYAKLNKPNLTIKLIDGKFHAPHVLNEGQGNEILSKCGLIGGVLTPYDTVLDYKKMSEIDPDICNIIVDFFNN